jgi:Leucine-rich repeat (LRR) protein
MDPVHVPTKKLRSWFGERSVAILCLLGCRTASIPPQAAAQEPRCGLPEHAERSGISVSRWPYGDGCEVELKGPQDDLRPLIPLLAQVFDDATGRRVLHIKLKRLGSIAGLEALPPLDELSIHGAHLADLSVFAHDGQPVRSVAGLKSLILEDLSISDMKPLGGLTGLEQLEISDCPGLIDIRPLGRLTRLRELSLYNTGVFDIRPIAALKKLEKLHVLSWPRREELVSLQPLSDLHGLLEFSYTGGISTDLGALGGMTKLNDLHLRIEQDLGPIPELPRLTTLMLESRTLDNIDALRRAPRLASLELWIERPIRLGVLADVPTLRELLVIAGGQNDLVADLMHDEAAGLSRRRPEVRVVGPMNTLSRPSSSVSSRTDL